MRILQPVVVLGTGTFGTVYMVKSQARDVGTKISALKVLEKKSFTEESKEHAREEFEVLRLISEQFPLEEQDSSRSFLCKTYGYFETEKHIFMN